MNWLDFCLGVGVLAIIPFALAAYGGHVAAETIRDKRHRHGVKLIFWCLCFIGVAIAIAYQHRIAKSDGEKQKTTRHWQEDITNKLNKIIETPVSKEQQQAAIELKREVAHAPNVPPYPIVVEFRIRNSHGPKEKLITITNPGRVGIEDVKIDGILYVFDKEAWKVHTLKLGFFSQMNVFATIPFVGPAKESKPIDMGKNFKLYDFNAPVDSQEPFMESEPMRTYYCLRFTFRDERTKEKYAFYKVTSAFYSAPLPTEEGVSAGGGTIHTYMHDVPDVVKAAAKEFYGNAVKEYKP